MPDRGDDRRAARAVPDRGRNVIRRVRSGGRTTAVKRELGLTDEGRDDIDSYYQSACVDMAPFVDEFAQAAATSSNQMTLERRSTSDATSCRCRHVETLMLELRESRIVMLYHMYLKLKPEQNKKLQDVQDRHFQREQAATERPGTIQRDAAARRARRH